MAIVCGMNILQVISSWLIIQQIHTLGTFMALLYKFSLQSKPFPAQVGRESWAERVGPRELRQEQRRVMKGEGEGRVSSSPLPLPFDLSFSFALAPTFAQKLD